MAGPIASTRNPGTTGTTFPDYMSGLEGYAPPNTKLTSPSAGDIVGGALQGNISNAPNLAAIADIVNSINQKAWLSAPGRQQELANVNRWQAGQLDPSVYEDVALQAAQRYGGGGFGVDSPAWQAAIQRAIVTNRQALQEKGAGALEKMYEGMPTTDVQKYTLTPEDYATVLDRQQAQQLQLAGLQQQGALESAKLAQARAFQEQDMALKQQEYDLQRKAQEAALYARYGYGTRPTSATTDAYLNDLRKNWAKYGYSGPPAIR